MTDANFGFPINTSHWTEIQYPLTDNAIDVTNWLRANVKGKWSGWRDRWRFQNASDATLFMMTWFEPS